MADSEDLLEGVPEMPEGKIPIQAPPNQAEAAGIGNVLAMVIPMMGSMGVMVFMAISQASGGAGQGRNSMMLMMAGGMVFAMVAGSLASSFFAIAPSTMRWFAAR